MKRRQFLQQANLGVAPVYPRQVEAAGAIMLGITSGSAPTWDLHIDSRACHPVDHLLLESCSKPVDKEYV